MDTIALILAGGAGTRLMELTRDHAKPALEFAGKYRAIDFSLSNCLHSGFRRISVLTQYQAHTLHAHLRQEWGFLRRESNEYVETLPPRQQVNHNQYAGTADAIYRNLDLLALQNPRYVLILPGDHVYRMDYRPMLLRHIQSRSDMTIACVDMPATHAQAFGLVRCDDTQRITGFKEKPQHPHRQANAAGDVLASMGIYIFNWLFLCKILAEDAANPHSSHDFGKDIIPRALTRFRIGAYRFINHTTGLPGYWRDIGTLDAFFNAHMDLLQPHPPLDLHDNEWPIIGHSSSLPSAQFVHHQKHPQGGVTDSLLCDDAMIARGQVKHCVISAKVRVGSYALLDRCVIFPKVEIGRHCKLRNVIVDRECKIPPGTTIGFDQERDRKRFSYSDNGVILVSAKHLTRATTNVA